MSQRSKRSALSQHRRLPRSAANMNYRIFDFSFKTLQGSEFSNKDIAGKKVFIIFTKTSCPTCMKQALFLNEVYRNWPKDSEMLMFMVASNEKQKMSKNGLRDTGWSCPYTWMLQPIWSAIASSEPSPRRSFLIPFGYQDIKSGGFGTQKEMEASKKHFYEQVR
jgi:thiol-disulfide isomerase/thioredoxin